VGGGGQAGYLVSGKHFVGALSQKLILYKRESVDHWVVLVEAGGWVDPPGRFPPLR